MELKSQVFPGAFNGAAADGRRGEFDIKNSVIINNETPVDVVFIGDSITHFWELNAYFRDFGLVLNRGIGGDIVEILKKRFEADVIQLKPKVCVLMIGINNMGVFDWETPMPVEELLAFYKKEYGEIMEIAHKYDQKMVLCSVMPVNIINYPNNKIRNETVPLFNNIIKEYAEKYGHIYVDYHSSLIGDDGMTLKDGLAWDGLHPHVAGYNIMADLVRPAIEKALKE